MEWAEIDSLVWLGVALALLYWGARSLVAYMSVKGWLGQDFSKALLNVIPS